MKVYLTKWRKTYQGWQQGYDWVAYRDNWVGMASHSNKDSLIQMCKEAGWEYEDYVEPPRKALRDHVIV